MSGVHYLLTSVSLPCSNFIYWAGQLANDMNISIHLLPTREPIRRGNNGVSQYPRYQKIFWLTENFNRDYRYFVVDITLMAEI